MALVTCPDCNKKVSSRAENCPFCGCPSEYFVDDNTVQAYEENEITDMIEEEESEDREVLEEFNILGKTIRYYKDEEIYIKALKTHNKASVVGEKLIRENYNTLQSMDDVWKVLVPKIQEILKNIVNENLRILYKCGIILSPDEFIQKYNVRIENYIEEGISAYNSILETAEELRDYREIQRGSRSRWVGGGFGLKGAVKGAMTAGALNAVTGVGRFIGDSIQDSADRSKINKLKNELYRDEGFQEDLFNGFKMCVFNADRGTAEELYINDYTERYEIDLEKSLRIYESAQKYGDDNKEIALRELEAIELFPFFDGYYHDVFMEVAFETDEREFDDFARLVDFWNMSEELLYVKQAKEKVDKVNMLISSYPECQNMDMGYNYQDYIKIREIRDIIVDGIQCKSPDDLMIPGVCMKIYAYWETCLGYEDTLNSISVIPELTPESNEDVYFRNIYQVKKRHSAFLEDFWIHGEKNSSEYNFVMAYSRKNCHIPENDMILLLRKRSVISSDRQHCIAYPFF